MLNQFMKFISMKKLLFTLILFFLSFSLNAQENDKQQFVKNYNYARVTDSLGVQGEWCEVDCRIFFNYGGNPSKIKLYLANTVTNFSQISTTKRGTTDKGNDYFELYLMNEANGEEIMLYYFADPKYGIRFIDFSNNIFEFNYIE